MMQGPSCAPSCPAQRRKQHIVETNALESKSRASRQLTVTLLPCASRMAAVTSSDSFCSFRTGTVIATAGAASSGMGATSKKTHICPLLNSCLRDINRLGLLVARHHHTDSLIITIPLKLSPAQAGRLQLDPPLDHAKYSWKWCPAQPCYQLLSSRCTTYMGHSGPITLDWC